jgi:hypothetical protein
MQPEVDDMPSLYFYNTYQNISYKMFATTNSLEKTFETIDKYGIWVYNKSAKLIKYCKLGIIFLLGEVYLFRFTQSMNLIKREFRFV